MSKTLKPQIRFKGYDGEWTTKSLSEPEFNIQAGGDVDKTLLHTSGEYPVIANALTNDGILGYYDEIYRIKAPAISVTGRGDVGIAIPRRINFTPVVRLLALTSPHDIDFLSCAINLHPTVLESTGVPQLTVPKLQSYSINFPEKKEQKEIGQYFKLINTQIKEAEREVDRLEKMKIASLQKMFPRPGATTPEIRFAGFSEPWKTMTFKDVYSSLKNNTLSRDCLNYNGGIAKNIHYGDVLIKFGAYVNPLSVDVPFVNFNVGIELSSAYKLADGDVIFADTAEDEAVGKCTEIRGVNDSNVLSGLHTIAVRPNFKFAPFYLGYYHNSNAYHSQLLPLMQGVKVLSINRTAISETMVAFPSSLDEQRAIGEYFRNLDELIAAKRKSIVKLRNIKKACLSKMFVNDTNL